MFASYWTIHTAAFWLSCLCTTRSSHGSHTFPYIHHPHFVNRYQTRPCVSSTTKRNVFWPGILPSPSESLPLSVHMLGGFFERAPNNNKRHTLSPTRSFSSSRQLTFNHAVCVLHHLAPMFVTLTKREGSTFLLCQVLESFFTTLIEASSVNRLFCAQFLLKA